MTSTYRCRRRPRARSVLLIAGLTVASATAGCEQGREPLVESVGKGGPLGSHLEPTRLGKALNALVDPLPNPVRILSVKVLHRQVILQVQAKEDPTEVEEYRFRDGKVSGPTKVTLLGAGKLQDNLFPLQAASPQVGCDVVRSVSEEYGAQGLKVRKLVMTRNLPRSRDIQFKVFLDGPDGVLLVKADKNGRLLGSPEPAPDSYQ